MRAAARAANTTRWEETKMMNSDKTINIDTLFREIAATNRVRLGYDTHYDANNYVFSWWKGKDYHRLDFQPIADSLAVTHLTDRYSFLPHICHWLYSTIPEIFRFPPSVQFTELETIKLDNNNEMRMKVEAQLNAAYNHSLQRIAGS
jgi:hypothetical protein